MGMVVGVDLSIEGLSGFFETVLPYLNEPQQRVVAGPMAESLGRGGQARVVGASSMRRARRTRVRRSCGQRARGARRPDSMKLVIDANLSPKVAQGLRKAGFQAVHVADLDLLSTTDDEIFD